MHHQIKTQKSILRKSVIVQRKKIPAGQYEEVSNETALRLPEHIRTLTGKDPDQLTIMSYMSYHHEFPLRDTNQRLLDSGARLILPYTSPDFLIEAYYVHSLSDLIPSSMGIPEPDPERETPASPADPDVILMPGVAFDRRGCRVGHGKGCYDRFLAQVPDETPVIGMAFSLQLFDEVPCEEHDRRCHYLFTEKEWIPCL